MKLEVKRLETCYGGGVYICLDDYAETNSIKCKVANIGEEIIPNKFTYDGTPYFSYDIFKKYSKENPYAKIYVEVEYEPKELELNSCMYNTSMPFI